MSLKIYCNHGIHLFKCQTCIDDLVAPEIKKLDQRNIELMTRIELLELYGRMVITETDSYAAVFPEISRITDNLYYKDFKSVLNEDGEKQAIIKGIGGLERELEAHKIELMKLESTNKTLHNLMVTGEKRGIAKATEDFESRLPSIKAEAIRSFVNHMIAAFDAGFVDGSTLTLAQIHRVMQNYNKDNYGVEVPHISSDWSAVTCKQCGFVDGKLMDADQ